MKQHRVVLDNNIGNLETCFENSKGIIQVMTGKQILEEKEKFDLLKYVIHLESLEEQERELMNVALETNHSAFDVKILAKL